MPNGETLNTPSEPLNTSEKTKRHVLTNKDKAAIIEAIRICNGITVSDVASKTSLSYPSVRYCMKGLVEQGVIDVDRNGHNARYYIRGDETIPTPKDRILVIVAANPGCSVKQVAFVSGLPYHFVRRHILKMIAEGSLRSEGKGPYQRIYVQEVSA